MSKEQKQPFESTLQDLVYSVDAGSGLKFIQTLLFCLLVLGIIVIFTARNFRGFNDEASMDQAQLARNLAERGEYVTQCVRPVTIATVSANTFNGDPMIDHHPELFRPPVYPAIMAGAFKFFKLVGVELFPISDEYRGMRAYPAEQWVVIPLNHTFAALTGLFLYLLGGRLFSKKLGLLSATTYFLTHMVWEDSLTGVGLPVVGFFVTGSFFFAMQSMIMRRERSALWKWGINMVLCAVFSATAVLTHYSALAILPGIALFILMMGSRSQRGEHLAFFYLVGTGLLLFPWVLHNLQVSGMPLGLAPYKALIDSGKYPADALMRTLVPGFNPLADFAAARSVWSENFIALYEKGFTALGGGILIALFATTYLYRFVRVHVHNLRWGIGLSMILFFVGACFFGEEALPYYHVYWPFVILYALAFFSILLDRLDLTIDLFRMGLTGLVVSLTALPLLISIFFAPVVTPTYPPYYAPFVMRVSELLTPQEVMCTDMPWATAWYGKRTSILLPATIDDFYEINDNQRHMSGLYLTTLTKDRPFVSSLLEGPNKSWLPILMGRLTPDFPLRHGFGLNKSDQLFLSDRVRWGAAAGGEAVAGAPAAPVAE